MADDPRTQGGTTPSKFPLSALDRFSWRQTENSGAENGVVDALCAALGAARAHFENEDLDGDDDARRFLCATAAAAAECMASDQEASGYVKVCQGF